MSDGSEGQPAWTGAGDRARFPAWQDAMTTAGRRPPAPARGYREADPHNQQAAISSQCLDAYLGSYSGMAGNPSADLWFCDVRAHAEPAPLASLLAPVAAPLVWDTDFRMRHSEMLARWATQQKLARIAAAVRSAADSVEPCEAKQYFEQRLYGPSGHEFKLSLFPLPTLEAGARGWTRLYGHQPVLNPQERYLGLCREGSRFRFIAALRRQWQPKVIVCLGSRNTDDFLQAFGFADAPQTEHVLQPADQGKPIQVCVDGPTTLLICPPLSGASGLNSDVLQTALGRYIARLM
ncbi:transcriptional regulator [Cupriavidus sp. 2TAF22]|uniref:transcriptional regulator n=1 Tax=unclassified Cupriavidus TaxID=2640874 RepID=UPI003F921382